VALLDLDHFKHINDVHGHEAGDEVLRMAARVLRKHSRRGDLLCRFGGEEFLLVCPGADLQAATKAAERLRSKIADEPIVRAGYQGRLTVSIGVAVRGPGMLGMDGLLKAADEALYAAKQAGRNRVVTAKAS
jgi:diguanylate cyclase (GGDEF)-like protein